MLTPEKRKPSFPKVAAVQMCSSDNVDENLRAADAFIKEAAAAQAGLVVLPENFALMSLTPADKLKHKETFGQGKIQNFLSNAAKENNVWIVGGTIPIASEDNENKVRAACLMYDNQGYLAARYDKIHLFDAIISETERHKESDVVEPGPENNVVVVDTPVGKVGIAICFDVRFADHFRALFNRGAEIIVLPSAFTVKTGKAHWKLLTRCRAIDTFSYFIGAGQGGTHTSGRKTYGHSVIVDPWGEVVAELGDSGTGVIYSDIDLAHLYQIRDSIPLACDVC